MDKIQFLVICLAITIPIAFMIKRSGCGYNPNKFLFCDANGRELINGCLVFPDHSYSFLDRNGQCEMSVVDGVKAVALFDKKGNLIAEWSES